MKFYRPSIRAWLRDVREAVGCFLAADYIEHLGDTIHDATKTIRELEASRNYYVQALAKKSNHPTMGGNFSPFDTTDLGEFMQAVDDAAAAFAERVTQPSDDDLAELAGIDSLTDILYTYGPEWSK